MRGLLLSSAAVVFAALPACAMAQESGDAPPPLATEVSNGTTREVYVPADFARFAPNNALDMLNQVPGFSIAEEDQGRGLGQANSNVLINGQRVASKSESVFDVLRRIAAARVERIEIVDGASLGIPGLSGQVANVITGTGQIGGRFEYRAIWRPNYAKTSYGSGEISLSGSSPRVEWSAAYSHGVGRGGAGGGEGTTITDAAGNVIETREGLIQFVGEYPKLSGRLKWNGPGSLVASVNASYSRTYTDSSNDEWRHVVGGGDLFRDFSNDDDGYDYEIGGDVDFALGPGRLKLIGIERYERFFGPATSLLIPADGSPATGTRFDQTRESGEHIGRGEYRWDMIGGNWQMDAEAAFNRYSAVSSLEILQPDGVFTPIPFPGATGGVTEDRYEMILTHNRTLAPGLTLQVGGGAEYSKLVQTGPGGLAREFWRPKGSLTLAWTARPGLDVSLKLARTVGQLSFGDFLANVDLEVENGNAGNADLVPEQAWEADLEIKKNLQAWGSATLRVYGRHIEDYIDIIPVDGGLESIGNIAGGATLYGASINATINLDPLGWKGARITANGRLEDSSLSDPLTGIDRPFSSHNYAEGEVALRYDIPASNWAVGGGFEWDLYKPYVRLSEVGHDYEGPVYTYAFIENKNVLGLTVNLNVFNLTSGQSMFDRTVWTGLRDRSAIEFVERRRMFVSAIYRLTVKGSF
ncbi:MAG TPA: TonB-dependent receptor [Croceibacterium sp.]|nr:TonB-dependent receptor [Croceibacterium sp.]